METSRIISSDKATVVIQVNPQMAQNAVIRDDGQKIYRNTALTKFFKAEPKALGTVQIMIGVVVFLFGVVLTSNDPYISVISGIVFWGSFIYISAGSLSVAAQNKLHPCVVKASLGMNVFSAVTAGISIIINAADLVIINLAYQRCYLYDSYRRENICMNYKPYNLGILGIFLVFSILQFIISICISGFACKATCNGDSTMINVALNQGH